MTDRSILIAVAVLVIASIVVTIEVADGQVELSDFEWVAGAIAGASVAVTLMKGRNPK